MAVCRIVALLFAVGVGFAQCTGEAETISLGHLDVPDEAFHEALAHDDVGRYAVSVGNRGQVVGDGVMDLHGKAL